MFPAKGMVPKNLTKKQGVYGTGTSWQGFPRRI